MEELTKLRTKFVANVSGEIVNQLLDNMLEEKVISSREKNSITVANPTICDTARKLIDTVKVKGDKASKKLIEHFEKCDPTLYEELRQSCGLTVQCATQESQVQQASQSWSSTLKVTTETFWKEKHKGKDIYPVTLNSSKNRVALLITNITFVDKSKNRAGAEKDEENMKKILTHLQYDVVKHTDLTAKQMNEALVQFSKHPKLKETDSVFVVIMSHGKLGSVLGVNFKSDSSAGEEPDELPIDNIFKLLNAENCPDLVNKPKIIIIQACRGEKHGAVLVHDSVEADDSKSAREEDLQEDTIRSIHREKDFTALLSCTPDTVSYRHPSHGCLLIQFIVEVFNTFAHNCDIEELFRKVMQRFEDLPQPRQMPCKDRCTLTRNFFLFPGLKHMRFNS